MSLLLRVTILLAIAVGLAWHFNLVPPAFQASVGQAGQMARKVVPEPEPPSMYKWTDANGRVVYGNEPPPGRRAERVGGGTVSVVEATKIPPPAPSQPAAGGLTLQQQITERAIEANTR